MSNALNPDLMTPAARLAEIGRILAAGVMRQNAVKSSGLSAEIGDCFVDLPADQARIIQLLVWRFTVATAGLEVDLRKDAVVLCPGSETLSSNATGISEG